MGKKKLLAKIVELEEKLQDYEDQEEIYLQECKNAENLQKENISLKKELDIQKSKIREMSNSEKLYDQLLRYEKARTQIAINHNNVLDAICRLKNYQARMANEFTPYFEKFEQAIHSLSDEFLIPIDKNLDNGLLCKVPERVQAWEERSLK